MDEGSFTFDVPSDKPLDFKGVKIVVVYKLVDVRKPISLLFESLGDGTKLPPMTIFKQEMFPKKIFSFETLSMCMK